MQDRLMDELKKTILAVKFKKLGPFAFSIVLLGDLKSSHQSEILHSLIFCAIDPSYNIFTARKQSLRRLCFYTCLSFCSGGGGSAAFHAGMHPPGPEAGIPPGEQTPPPPAQCMLGNTDNKRAVRILLESSLVSIYILCLCLRCRYG